jgi:hypothetical protein
MEFAADERFRRMTQVQRLERTHDLADHVRVMAVIASEVLTMSKAELVAKLEREYESLGPALMELAKAKDKAEALLDVIKAAEARLAIALAVVEGDE